MGRGEEEEGLSMTTILRGESTGITELQNRIEAQSIGENKCV